MHHPKHEVNVAIVGKYIDLPDAYLSVTEAIKAGGFANWAKVNVKWVAADKCATEEGAAAALDQVDGIVIPAASASVASTARSAPCVTPEHKLPALGLCLGLQSMVIEYARDVLGITDANSSEFDPDCANPVIATMEEQKDIVAGKGDIIGGWWRFTEFVELPQDVHPFYVGTQAHPEFKSRPTKPHPLFAGLAQGRAGSSGSPSGRACGFSRLIRDDGDARRASPSLFSAGPAIIAKKSQYKQAHVLR